LAYGRLIAVAVLYDLAVAVGLLAFVVSGVVLFTWLALAAPLVELQGCGVQEAFTRSRRMVRGQCWPVLAVLGPITLASQSLYDAVRALGHEILGHGLIADWFADAATSIVVYPLYAVAAAPLCLPIPNGISMVEAAAIPETFFTVWTNLFDRGRCKAGETVLIHGGTSGIGTTAIQLAAAWGARVFATAGSDDKARACERLGAVRGINYRTEDFVEVMRAQTDGKGVDVTLDMVAGSYVPRNLEIAALEGRVVVISLLGGSRAEINMGLILTKRLTLTGSTLRTRTVSQKAEVADAVHKNIWPLLAAGRVRPVIHATFPLAEAAEAHRLMETSSHIGKIVLTV
jgi:putative PIG3 family NAD(P)H quinone oxidoreductase